ncbi:hypothetical protein ES703_92451 [subsurface metagenome]
MNKLKIDPKNSYHKHYRLRLIGGGISVSVPKELVERRAREIGMTVKDFAKNYGVTMMFDFDDVDGAFTFEKKSAG